MLVVTGAYGRNVRTNICVYYAQSHREDTQHVATLIVTHTHTRGHSDRSANKCELHVENVMKILSYWTNSFICVR